MDNSGSARSNLSVTQLAHFQRQIILPQVGFAGQLDILNGKVLIIGVGGLGCVVAQYLGAAGVGTIGLLDNDTIELSNLQRQILYSPNDVGNLKSQIAAKRLANQYPETRWRTIPKRFQLENAKALISGYDIIVDASDNYSTRYLINDACFLMEKPYVSASIYQFQIQINVFNAKQGPCYRCLFPQPPNNEDTLPDCSEAGILGATAGIAGTWQALEVIKLLAKIPESLQGKILQINCLDNHFQIFNLTKNESCPLCSNQPSINELFQELEPSCIPYPINNQIDPIGLFAWLQTDEPPSILDIRSPREFGNLDFKSFHIPFSELEARISELSKSKKWVVVCFQGVKSKKACEFLSQNGFANVYNLQGGAIRYLHWLQNQPSQLSP